MSKLTVLSLGGGQDSTTILLKMIHDLDFKKRYASEDLVVIMSDTGNEHPYTYSHVKKLEEMCLLHSIPFFFLTSDMGYHTPAWPNLIDPQVRPFGGSWKTTMVQTGTKSCTDKLKLGPIYKFLDEYINKKYGYNFPISKDRGCRKKAIKQFFIDHGRISVLIGFSRGEENRSDKSITLQKKQNAKHWEDIRNNKKGSWQHILDRIFPLIELGMDRKACTDYIESILDYEVLPSNCMLCPYQSPAELLWLSKNHPDMWDKWVNIEMHKIARFKKSEDTIVVNQAGNKVPFKNHGVYNSKKLLPERLIEAQEKFGYMTDLELHEYKKFHGCQTNLF